jgi:AraC-like DNA-binding protein
MGGDVNLLLVPAVAHVFENLRISATVYRPVPWWGNAWWPIHTCPGVLGFENEHGREAERSSYNERSFRELYRKKRTVRGEHGGYSDLFVPVLVGKNVAATLIVGPFLRARPTSVQILERWRTLTARQGHLADPQFAAYLSAVLSTLVLDGGRAEAFERLLERFAELIADPSEGERRMRETYLLRLKLEQARSVDHAWEVAVTMVDDRSPHSWSSTNLAYELGLLGLSRAPEHAMVGFFVGHAPELEPVEYAVRRDALQRACVPLARKAGELVAGRVGDHGVVFLSSVRGTKQRCEQRLFQLADRVSTLARRSFGLDVHFGACLGGPSVPLSRTYQAAVGAAEAALTQDTRMVVAAQDARQPAHSLRHLREELGSAVEERPKALAARFDRYLEAVAIHCAYRLEPARAHLEVGFEKLTAPLRQSGALDPKSFDALCDALDRAAGAADTLQQIFAAYRRAAADVTDAVERPSLARHDRSLRSAVDFIHRHYTEPIRAKQIARVAGFNPTYFSLLFKKREGTTFDAYVRSLRMARARHLLTSTDLSVTRVAELSGHRSVAYFCRAFQCAVGRAPLAYRRRPGRTRSKVSNKRS